MHIDIGPYRIDPAVVLAPMSGITDAPFRAAVAQFGAGLVVSEMVASRAMIDATRGSFKELRKLSGGATSGLPWVVQLAGCDAQTMAESARVAADLGVQIIDLNFGCPAKKVTGQASGSALMQDEVKAAEILAAVVKAVDVPVTLKMRLGWAEAHRNAPQIAKIAQDQGIAMLSVHGRTRTQKFNGQADWRAVHAVKAAVTLPLLVNGDITTAEAACEALEDSGADGLMVGRGVLGRPWFLAEIAAHLAGRPWAPPAPEVISQAIVQHFNASVDFYGPVLGVKVFRKHLTCYAALLTDPGAFRARVMTLENPVEIAAAITQGFSRFKAAA